MTPRLFGLTGGIASGKSTVAARFRELGVPVLDADQVAREVVLPGSPGLAEVVAAFGPEVLAGDGSLDRGRLAALVFGDDDERRRLNAILHPRIGARTLERAAELGTEGHALVCYEATLLVENGLAEAFRPLVVVSVPEALQVARGVARSGSAPSEVLARVRAQLPLLEKVKLADVVIDASGTLEETRALADEALARVRELAGSR